MSFSFTRHCEDAYVDANNQDFKFPMVELPSKLLLIQIGILDLLVTKVLWLNNALVS